MGAVGEFVQNVGDEITGKAGRKRKRAVEAEVQTQQAETAKIEADRVEAEQSALNERESERRNTSRSNTLLTGSEGVEDEEENISRRTLLGS